jgi:hypothetical protein
MKHLLAALLIVAGCGRVDGHDSLLSGGTDCGASGFLADAAIDGAPDAMIYASPDAPPDALVVTFNNRVWQRVTIMPPIGSAGADGVDVQTIGGLLSVTAADEQGGKVRMAQLTGDASLSSGWTEYTACASCPAVEDAKFGDLDGDGKIDIVSASDLTAGKIWISYSNATLSSTWTQVDVTSAHGHNHWMQVAIADIDGDGLADIVAEGRIGSASNPAVLAWFKNPGATSARTAGAWTYNFIRVVGWGMSLYCSDLDGDGDTDCALSDRGFDPTVPVANRWDHWGSGWVEQTPTGWVMHQMQQAGGCANCTPGDAMMMALYDLDGDGLLDVVDGQSSTGHINYVEDLHNPGWSVPGIWSRTRVTSSEVNTNTGHYQAIAVCDIDGDGRQDRVVSNWESDTAGYTAGSGIYWLHQNADGSFTRMELIGSAGTKFDNVWCGVVPGVGNGHPSIIANDQLGWADAMNTAQLGTFLAINPYPNF